MNTNRKTSRPFGIVAAVLCLWATPAQATPSTIADLTLSSGTASGSLNLQWTAPDNGSGGTVSRYSIRYRFGTSIVAAVDWNGASIVSTPPVPMGPGLTQNFTVEGLEPGVNYAFAIRSYDSSEVESWISNSPVGEATAGCGQSAFDGQAIQSASLLPAVIEAGKTVVTTMTITIGNPGIQTGGKVALKLPEFWPLPSTNTATGSIGYTSITTTATATLELSFDRELIVLCVTTGTLTAGTTIGFHYTVQRCELRPDWRYRLFTQYNSCGVLAETIHSKQIATVPGAVHRIDFERNYLAVIRNVITPIRLSAKDECNNFAAMTQSTNVVLAAMVYDMATYTYVPDPLVLLSTSADLSAATTSISVPVSATQNPTTFYYRTTASTEYRDASIQISDNVFRQPFWISGLRPMVYESGIANSSVDTGTLNPTQKAVAFSPDNDGVADSVFINFTLPTNGSFEVQISSNGFSSIARRIWGDWSALLTRRISWDGMLDNSNGMMAPPGTYQVRIVFGAGLVDETLSVTLTAAGVEGVVVDGASAPVPFANVNVFGPIARYTQTDANGAFRVYGLKAGQYRLQFSKTGYANKERVVPVSSSIVMLSTTTMDRQAILRLILTRPASANMPELFGSVNGNTSDYQSNARGNVHFGPGKERADANDHWNVQLTSHTALTLTPNKQYRIRFQIDSLSADDLYVTLGQGDDVYQEVSLVPMGSIEGGVSLPAGSNQNGTSISIEAALDANQDGVFDNSDQAQHRWGNAWINTGQSSATYRIYGVSAGSYTLVASAQGFRRLSGSVYVPQGTHVTANLGTLSVGGVATGTMTVLGDSRPLDERDGTDDGYFTINVNAWSQTLRTGSWTQVRLQENTNTASSTFTLTGLEDGTFDVRTHMDGYELVPPGRKTVTVSGGSGSMELIFQPYTGSLTGDITLPGGISVNNNVQLELRAYDWNIRGSSVPAFNGNTYTFSKLGTGYYALRARYLGTGYTVEKNVQIVNGRALTLNLNLSLDTYSIAGRVTTSARAPYNDLSYIISSSTPTTVQDLATQMPVALPAARVVAERLVRRSDSQNSTTAMATGIKYDSQNMLVGTYDADGNFLINNVTPGSYRLFTNGELDNDTTNGREVAEASVIVRILTSPATGQTLDISDGFDVSGEIRVADGTIPQGRQLTMKLKNAQGTEVVKKEFILSDTSSDFLIERVPSGGYVLSVNDEMWPKAFTAKDLRVDVKGAAVSNLTVDLLRPALIRGKLKMKQTGTLITTNNFNQLLPSNLDIWAQANPWFSGGSYSTSDPKIDSDGYFNIATNGGNYDVVFRVNQALSPTEVAQGKKQLVPLRISGIRVSAGQTVDLSVVELTEGDTVRGTIRDKSGALLPNVRVIAFPSGDQRYSFDPLETYTDELGQYVIQGIDSIKTRFYDIVASPRARSGDDRLADTSGPRYGEVRRARVDAAAQLAVDFSLQLAAGSVTGRVVSANGTTLEVPFGDGDGESKLGAHIIMNRRGDIPEGNPLGDIEMETRPDGTFEMLGLVPGSYTLWAIASNHASGIVRNITVGAASTNVGDIIVQPGHTMSGAVYKADGTLPGKNEVDTLVAVMGGFDELVIGETTVDAAGSITGYRISGFQTGKTYSILSFTKSNEIMVLADNVTLTGDIERDLRLTSRAPSILTTASKNPDGTVTVQFDFTGPLRNSLDDLDDNGVADDADASDIISTSSAQGTITYSVDWISSDRSRARVTYTPAAGETQFVLRVKVAFEATDLATGSNYSRDQNFTYHLGIGEVRAEFFSNAAGGTIEIGNSKFTAQPGSFGEAADEEVEVVFRSADDADNFSAAAANPRISRALAVAERLGLKAYPSEMAGAINRVRTTDVDVFSSFYDIFLPAGVSHFFPEGREANLCIAYDTSVADPYALNVYYFNTATNEYLLESENKTVDTDNTRICVSLGHASVFTVLASSAAVISGAGYTGELAVMNFPNPFNLNTKTVTLQNPGSASASQSVQGTMIKVSVPGDIAGALEIEIYSVSGEKVRTIHDNIPAGGAHYYVPWEGTNDAGAKVASGTYVARLTIGGSNEKFFKMAVIK